MFLVADKQCPEGQQKGRYSDFSTRGMQYP